MSPAKPEDKFDALLQYLKHARGFDLTGYKRSNLMRRVQKRMAAITLSDFADYVDYLEVHPDEFTHLFNAILINVTAFFRDPAAWDFVAQEVVPKIIEARGPRQQIRVWSAGCASGEEAYTITMILAEALGQEEFRERVKVYATDVDEEALAQARQALYSARAVEAVPPTLRTKHFDRSGDRYLFNADLRRSVIFGRHDLVQDAPISRLDLLICRNTLMYFNAETQAKILGRLHFAVREGGYLFLGQAELLLTHNELFTAVDLRHRIFASTAKGHVRDRPLALAQAGAEEAPTDLAAHQTRLREAAFDATLVAQILVDSAGRLLLANERARSLLGLHPGDLGRPIQDLEISYRPLELRSRIEAAYEERLPVKVNGVERRLPDGTSQSLDVLIVPLKDQTGAVLGVSISFSDVTRYAQLQAALHRSKQELETAYEELQSANEELETTNAELQSTNEELETMNEELQSTNEELQAVNNELRQRTDDLNKSNTFLQAVLMGLRAGVVVVDARLTVLVWNHWAENLWGLRAEEVVGQPLLSLDIGLPLQSLVAPLRACLSQEQGHQEITLRATNRLGKMVECRITCNALDSPDQSVKGAIILMEEQGAR